MSATAEPDDIGLLGKEPSGELRYLSDGIKLEPEIVGVERQELAAAGKRFLKASGGDACLVLVGPLVSETGKGDVSTEGAIIRCCTARFDYPETRFPGTIDLILDTLGGSLDSAFKTVLFLARFAERLRVFVPRRAKSAGTLIAIGANQLYMSPFGELGPLDTQIRDPRNPVDRVSALDCYQSVDYVRAFGLTTLSRTFRALAADTRTLIPLAELVNTAANFSVGSITPILTQVNALDFGGWGRTLRIGEMYARTLLSRAEYDAKSSAEIAEHLVYGYTHHPFPIDMDEAERVGLRVLPMTKEQYNNSLDIVTRCTEPGIVVVGFAEEEAGESGEAVAEIGDHLEEQQRAAAVKDVRRKETRNVPNDSRAHPIASLDEGESGFTLLKEGDPITSRSDLELDR